jgi:hypothetical protein
MRRAVKDALISAGALTLLFIVLVAIDDRVRDELSWRIKQAPSVRIASADTQAHRLVSAVSDAAREQSREHGPLLLFAFAGSVLVLFMIKT